MRLLILSASAGAGHTRAAQALEAAAREIPGVEAEHWDVLAHVDRLYRKAYAAGYLSMVDKAPELWGALYRASDRKPPRGLNAKLVQAFDRIEFAGFRRRRPDVPARRGRRDPLPSGAGLRSRAPERAGRASASRSS